MTPIDRFERRLPDQLDELAAARTPAYLDDLLTRTSATRQRPRWTFPERWLPMTIALRRPWSAIPLRPVAAGLALLVLLTAAGLLGAALAPKNNTVTMLSPRVGGVVYEHDGDLWTVDPDTDEQALLVENGVWPIWAPDGERLFFLRPDGDVDVPMVLEGGVATEWLDAGLREVQTISWSPDSDAVAVSSMVDGRPQISLLRDGPATLGIGLPETELDWPAWDPASGRSEWTILVRSRSLSDPAARASLIRTFGKEGTTQNAAGGFLDAADVDQSVGALSVLGAECNLLGATWNPAATLSGVAYTQLHTLGTEAPDGNGFRVHVTDGTVDHALEFDLAADDEAWPVWAPDGRHVAFQSYEGTTGTSRVVIAAAPGQWCPDGCITFVASNEFPVSGPNDLGYTWSPDGTQLLVVDSQWSAVRLVDAATGAFDLLPWKAEFADWR